jgi:hypothetical protein
MHTHTRREAWALRHPLAARRRQRARHNFGYRTTASLFGLDAPCFTLQWRTGTAFGAASTYVDRGDRRSLSRRIWLPAPRDKCEAGHVPRCARDKHFLMVIAWRSRNVPVAVYKPTRHAFAAAWRLGAWW